MPPNFIIRKRKLQHGLSKDTTELYTKKNKTTKLQEKINYFTYTDDFKIFAKEEKELETPI